MKKNREAKKAKKELESNSASVNGQVTSTKNLKTELTDDPEKNKKIKKVQSVRIYLIIICCVCTKIIVVKIYNNVILILITEIRSDF